MATTEWRVLEVDEHGDIESQNECPTIAEAKRDMIFRNVPEGKILTIEGQRDYDNDNGRTFKRTGLVKGKCLTAEQKRFQIKDDHWYASGEEPDFKN